MKTNKNQITKTMSKQLSKLYSGRSDVKIKKLLSSIHVFHEVIMEEYNMAGHPYIKLQSDGSGCVWVPRFEQSIFQFRNLKELIKKADELIIKYNIVWDN
jgi:hypothetical protein